MSRLVVGGNEVIDMVAELLWTGKAGASQRMTLEEREPDFDLIHPRGMGGREVKVNLAVAGEPAVALGLVSIEIVQDDVDLLLRVLGQEAVHKIQKLHPAAAPIVTALNQPGGHFQRRK